MNDAVLNKYSGHLIVPDLSHLSQHVAHGYVGTLGQAGGGASRAHFSNLLACKTVQIM